MILRNMILSKHFPTDVTSFGWILIVVFMSWLLSPKAEGTNLPKIGYTSTTVDDLCRIISCCRGCMANMTNPLSLFAPWKREFTVFGL
jgi:hypothetical protein